MSDTIIFYILSSILLLYILAKRVWKKHIRLSGIAYALLIPFMIIALTSGLSSAAPFLFSAALISMITILLELSPPFSIKKSMIKLSIYTLSFLLINESASIIIWILTAFYSIPPQNSIVDNQLIILETQIFYAASRLAPLFVAVTLFSWIFFIVKLILPIRGLKFRGFKWRFTFKSILRPDEIKLSSPSKLRTLSVMLLSIFLILSITYYPYSSILNPSGNYKGVDIPNYSKWLLEADKSSVMDALTLDRPLSLIFLYIFWKATAMPALIAVQSIIFLLGILLVISVFLFLYSVRVDYRVKMLALLFTAFSFHVTMGVYGAFISNWMCLIGVYVFSAFFVKAMDGKSWRWSGLAAVTMSFLLFLHSYTWTMLMGVLAVYAVFHVIKWLRVRGSMEEFRLVGAILIVNLLLDFARNTLINRVGVAVEATRVAGSNLSLRNIPFFWDILGKSVSQGMEGTLMNPLMYVLAIFGAFVVFTYWDKPFYRYLGCWLIASSLPLLLGSSLLKIRVLYNIPFQILAAIGLSAALKFIGGDSKVDRTLRLVLVLLVIMINVNYAFRCMYVISQFTFTPLT